MKADFTGEDISLDKKSHYLSLFRVTNKYVGKNVKDVIDVDTLRNKSRTYGEIKSTFALSDFINKFPIMGFNKNLFIYFFSYIL